MTGVPSQITDIFTSAASNSPAGSDAIGTSLDDYLRAIQAIMRQESENKTWERWNDTPTRTGNTTFTVTSDLTARYIIGRRIKCVDSSTLYGVITAASFGAGITTVTVLLDSGNLSGSLTEVQLGIDARGYARPFTTEATIASATTTDLGTLLSNIASVTGVVTITSFGSAASTTSPLYFVRFTGALLLTYNATSLILPTAANITTVAGDAMIAKYEGSGNWRVLAYFRADGTPVGGATYKVGATTRDISSATGNFSVTGVGFKPKAIDFICCVQGTTDGSWGFDDGTNAQVMLTGNNGTAGQLSNSGASSIFFTVSAGNTYTGKIASFDADGFTIAGTKAGSPTGTGQILFKAYR